MISFAILGAVLLAGHSLAQQCAAGEQYYPNSCVCDRSCDNLQSQECFGAGLETLCKIGCGCIPGYVRHPFGHCVPVDQCPPACSVGQKNYGWTCLPCQRTCTNWYIPTILCTADCKLFRCGCLPGYVINSSGICVPKSQCPPPVCPAGQQFYGEVTCAPCERKCRDGNSQISCNCVTNQCGCKCGYVRNNNGDCILPELCPRIAISS